MTIRTLAVATTLALAVPATAAYADARIDFRATEGGGAAMQSILIGQGKIRSDADADTNVVFDTVAGTMVVIDHDRREFTRIGKAELEQMGETMNQAMRQMEQALANVPPEMRAQMQGMIGGAIPGMGGQAMVKVEDTGRSDTVAGHACRIYRTQIQGIVATESCMGDAAALDELPPGDRATLESAMAMTREMVESLSSGPLGQFAEMAPFKDGMFPLRITEIEGGVRSTSEYAGIDTGALPADAFAIPAGFKEQKLEMPDLTR
jgi:hypothetical protein